MIGKIAMTMLGACTFVTTAVADTITVCSSGCDHTSIQAAIDAASDGDVIQLSAETYSEGAAIEIVDKSIALRGEVDSAGLPTSVIDGGLLHRGIRCEAVSGDPQVSLDHLIVRDGRGEDELYEDGQIYNVAGGVYAHLVSVVINNVHFTGNEADWGSALNVHDASASLVGCQFVTNTLRNDLAEPARQGCISIDGGGVVIQDCIIRNNEQGIVVWPSTANAGSLVIGASIICDNGSGLPLSESGEQPGINVTDLGTNCILVGDCVCEDDDGDGVFNQSDVCPGGDDFLDQDADGLPDACDGCPLDPLKIHPGDCGCGTGDTGVFGDVDCDGDYDRDDVLLGMSTFGIAAGDMDSDGDLDRADFEALKVAIGIRTLGCAVVDINADGVVNGQDMAYLLSYWGGCQ